VLFVYGPFKDLSDTCTRLCSAASKPLLALFRSDTADADGSGAAPAPPIADAMPAEKLRSRSIDDKGVTAVC
jgi:hypothetical protein